MDIKFNGVKLRETPDPRNYKVGKFVAHVDKITDEEFCLSLPQREIILNQKEINSCVGHSFALAKAILEYNHTNKWIEFSPSAIYGTRKDGEYIGEGMYMDQACSVLKHEGAFFRRDFHVEEEMPGLMDTVRDWKQANPDKVQKALDYTISGYGQANNVDEIKQYLKKGMPVTAIFPVYKSLYSVEEDGIVPVRYSGQILGYHCMTIIGWRKDNRWIVANSWGNNLGMKGLYYIPFVYPLNEGMAISDTIFPSKMKAESITMTLGKKLYAVNDNDVQTMDVAPFEENGRTYVPVRFVAEALGAIVEWNEDEKKVTIDSEEAKIEMWIDKREYTVNGVQFYNDVAPVQREDRTFLPIRVVAEALNCSVNWKEDEQKITISAL